MQKSRFAQHVCLGFSSVYSSNGNVLSIQNQNYAPLHTRYSHCSFQMLQNPLCSTPSKSESFRRWLSCQNHLLLDRVRSAQLKISPGEQCIKQYMKIFICTAMFDEEEVRLSGCKNHALRSVSNSDAIRWCSTVVWFSSAIINAELICHGQGPNCAFSIPG